MKHLTSASQKQMPQILVIFSVILFFILHALFFLSSSTITALLLLDLRSIAVRGFDFEDAGLFLLPFILWLVPFYLVIIIANFSLKRFWVGVLSKSLVVKMNVLARLNLYVYPLSIILYSIILVNYVLHLK